MAKAKGPWLAVAGCGCLGMLAAAVFAVVVLPRLLTPDFATEGGIELVLTPPPGDSPPEMDRELLERTMAVQRSRLDDYGARGAELEIVDGAIVARLPGSYDTERLTGLLTTRYRLELYELSGQPPTGANLSTPPPGTLPIFRREVDPVTGAEAELEAFLVRSQPFLGTEHVSDAAVEVDQFGYPYVEMSFTDEGRRAFCDVTTTSVQKQLPIVLDGVVHSAPVVQEPICGGRAAITLGSHGSRDELDVRARDLAVALRAGELPVKLSVSATRVVTPEG